MRNVGFLIVSSGSCWSRHVWRQLSGQGHGFEFGSSHTLLAHRKLSKTFTKSIELYTKCSSDLASQPIMLYKWYRES